MLEREQRIYEDVAGTLGPELQREDEQAMTLYLGVQEAKG